MSRDAFKRTPEQFQAYVEAVVKPDMLSGGDARKRHTLAKTIVETTSGTQRVTENVAYINDELVIWCPMEEA